MLGKFLELGVVAESPGESWSRYQQLGFTTATTGDLWGHTYGVVVCGGLAIGLHGKGEEALCVTYARPEVAALHRELETRSIPVEDARLGSDVFNELSLREPGGCQLRVLEARSFSPPLDVPATTQLGQFLSLSLPCRNLDVVAGFWNKLGIACTAIQEPWEGLTVQGTPLTYHLRCAAPEPVLMFQQDATLSEFVIAAADMQREKDLRSLGDRSHVLLRTSEDLLLAVLA
jgi:hypothetical protein